MKEFIINENEAGQRFDKYLAKLLREAPKSFSFPVAFFPLSVIFFLRIIL